MEEIPLSEKKSDQSPNRVKIY